MMQVCVTVYVYVQNILTFCLVLQMFSRSVMRAVLR